MWEVIIRLLKIRISIIDAKNKAEDQRDQLKREKCLLSDHDI